MAKKKGKKMQEKSIALQTATSSPESIREEEVTSVLHNVPQEEVATVSSEPQEVFTDNENQRAEETFAESDAQEEVTSTSSDAQKEEETPNDSDGQETEETSAESNTQEEEISASSDAQKEEETSDSGDAQQTEETLTDSDTQGKAPEDDEGKEEDGFSLDMNVLEDEEFPKVDVESAIVSGGNPPKSNKKKWFSLGLIALFLVVLVAACMKMGGDRQEVVPSDPSNTSADISQQPADASNQGTTLVPKVEDTEKKPEGELANPENPVDHETATSNEQLSNSAGNQSEEQEPVQPQRPVQKPNTSKPNTSKPNAETTTPVTKQVTVKADDKSSIYGYDDKALTFTVTAGNVTKEEIAPYIQLTREPGKNVGTYKITLTCTNPDYQVTAISGDYIITPRALTIKLVNQTSEQGKSLKKLTYSISSGSLADGDKEENVIRISTTANQNKAGKYPITAKIIDNNYVGLILPMDGAFYQVTAPSSSDDDNDSGSWNDVPVNPPVDPNPSNPGGDRNPPSGDNKPSGGDSSENKPSTGDGDSSGSETKPGGDRKPPSQTDKPTTGDGQESQPSTGNEGSSSGTETKPSTGGSDSSGSSSGSGDRNPPSQGGNKPTTGDGEENKPSTGSGPSTGGGEEKPPVGDTEGSETA